MCYIYLGFRGRVLSNLAKMKQIEVDSRQLTDGTLHRTILNNLDQGYCIIKMIFDESDVPVDYIFLETNPAFEEHTGLKNAVGSRIKELNPLHEDHWFRIYGDVAKSGKAVHFENSASNLKGGVLYDVNAFRVGDPGDDLVAVLFKDITIRKQMESLNEFNEGRNRVLSEVASELLREQDVQKGIDNIGQIVMKFIHCQMFFNFLVVPEGKRLHLNACHGITKKQAKNIELLDFGVAVCGCVAAGGKRIIAENIQNSEDKLTKLIKGYGVRAYCCHPLLIANSVIGTLSFGTTERDQWNASEIDFMQSVSGLMSVALHRKRLEEELIKGREQLEHAQSIGNIGNWRLDLIKNELQWSNENYRIFGLEKGTPQNYESFLSRVHPEDREYVDRKWTEGLVSRDYDIEHRIVVDGKIKWVRQKAFIEFDENGKVLAGVGITQDITKRKIAENDLAKAKIKLDLALENGKIGLIEWNRKINEVVLDERAANMLGLEHSTSKITFNRLEDLIHDEDLQRLKSTIKKMFVSKLPLETVFRNRSDPSDYISMRADIVYDNKGKPSGMLGVCLDMTAIKEDTEQALIKLNEELSRSNDDLQQFAYVASHDLQEPLRTIASFSQLLQLQYSDKLDEKANEYINFAVDGSKRMYELLNGLLAYSRVQTKAAALSEINMEVVVQKVKRNLKLLVDESGAEIISGKLPFVYADENQMLQLVQNLVDNAIKFCKRKPVIHISCKTHGGKHVFNVQDNGIGIEQQYFDRIFRIFQRLHLKDEYKGTGIGLAISKKIVERHGGEIWVESTPGHGSSFCFILPN